MTLMISVSGVRGIVGETMTPMLAAEMGAMFGSYLGGGTVVIGRDSRPSGTMVHNAVTSGMLAAGCHVVELGVVTTPGVALMVGERSAAGGVVITASHNPEQWNGIKFITSEGFAPPPELAEQIFDRYRRKDFHFAGVEQLRELERDLTTHDRHVAKVTRVLNVEAIRRRQLKVVLDSVNGAGGLGGKMLLERLGCKVTHLNSEPHGRFAHPPEPTAENLVGLCEAVREHGADVGFAQDPDADRLAIVDNQGRYIGEEYTVALATKYMLSKQVGAVAVNLSTSRMVDDLVAQAGDGAVVHRTPVGEANVARAVLTHGCVIGGEGNGGVIDPRVVPVRDSFVGMGLVLDLLAEDWRPLATIVDEMPRYVMIKQKFEVDREAIQAWLERVRMSTDGQSNDADGLRIDWPEGWVHVRPSNTEPIARVISEAADEKTAVSLARRITELL
ncbi:MAG: phosphoglucosamine mutase [Phycisphaerales bacterium]|nr:phosphoglucosamine mutase [Phycisphaerales bacterium]